MVSKRKICLLLVGYLAVSLSQMLPAISATNAIIWQTRDQIVQLAGQDDISAAANDHPKSVTPDQIEEILSTLRLRFADEEADTAPVTVFTKAELENLGDALATGLDRAAPSQDVIFHVVGSRRVSPGSFAKRNRVNAGRVFYRDGKFNVIFGQVQTPLRKKNVYGQTEEDFVPRNFGSRKKATRHEVVLLGNDAVSLVRDDWVVIEPAIAFAAATPETQSPAAVVPTQTVAPASAATAVVVADTSAVSSTSTSADPRKEQSVGSGESANVEERLETLKRLRDRDLISEEAYQSKMAEILQDL